VGIIGEGWGSGLPRYRRTDASESDAGRDGGPPSFGTLTHVWVALAAAVAWGAFTAGSAPPNDLWWHLRAGEWILAHGTIPRVDLFSYTQAGSPWIYQAWLSEVFLAWLHGVGGMPLLVAVGAALNVLGYGLAFWSALRGRRASQTSAGLRVGALAALLGMIVGAAAWQVRPQLLSIPMFGGLMAALWAGGADTARASDGVRVPSGLWALPLGFAVWANLHGGFVFGLVVVGIEVAVRVWRWWKGRSLTARHAVPLPRPLAGAGNAVATLASFPWQWVLLGLLCAVATLATPLGTGMVGYVLGFAQHPVTRNLNLEFAPVSARDPVGIVFLVHLGVLLALWLSQRHRPTMREALLLMAFAGLTFVAVRGVLWYGLVTTPMTARALARTPMFHASRGERVGVVWLNRVLLGMLALAAMATCPWLRGYLPHPAIDPAHPYLGEDTPVRAVEVLRELGDVRPFHTEAYGSYLIHAAPEIPVFVDTRIELYPPDQWDDYLAISMARYDWLERLEAYGVNMLLLDKERQPDLVDAVASDPSARNAWEPVYEDDRALVFRRR